MYIHSQDMSTLRDFIGYARSFVHPTLSEEAGQALVQAYVGEQESFSSGSVYW